MTRDTWEQMGRPRLYELGIYLKLADQGLIEPYFLLDHEIIAEPKMKQYPEVIFLSTMFPPQ